MNLPQLKQVLQWAVLARPRCGGRALPDELTFDGDVYQLVAYQSTYAVPGLLIFPEQDEELSTTYTVQDAGALSIVELPTKRSTSHGGFGRQLVRSFLAEMKAVL